jgi:uncharacterized protein with HEPN domain
MSEKKEWLFRIQDMLDHIAERCFEIIGAAARHVPVDVQKNHPNIEWAEIIGMRHKISHDYLEASPKVIWDTFELDIDKLEKQ